jgi:hypothetical protein
LSAGKSGGHSRNVYEHGGYGRAHSQEEPDGSPGFLAEASLRALGFVVLGCRLALVAGDPPPKVRKNNKPPRAPTMTRTIIDTTATLKEISFLTLLRAGPDAASAVVPLRESSKTFLPYASHY